jgi:hypothetical protein
MTDRNAGVASGQPEDGRLGGFEERMLADLRVMVARGAVARDRVGAASAGRNPAGQAVRAGSRRLGPGLLARPAWLGHRRRWLGTVVTAGVAVSVVAATVLTIAAGPAGGQPQAHGQSVALTAFLNEAAAAARSQSVTLPGPDQVFYEKVRGGAVGPGGFMHCYVMIYNSPATGRLGFPTATGRCPMARTGAPFKHGSRGYPDPVGLPTTPAALLATLDRDASRDGSSWGAGYTDLAAVEFFVNRAQPRDAIVFALIERLLQVPIRPALRAALFEVTGRIPGVELVKHAKDISGRPGVGIVLPLRVGGPGLSLEFVLNRTTYRFLGLALLNSKPRSSGPQGMRYREYGYAVLKSGLVTPVRRG